MMVLYPLFQRLHRLDCHITSYAYRLHPMLINLFQFAYFADLISFSDVTLNSPTTYMRVCSITRSELTSASTCETALCVAPRTGEAACSRSEDGSLACGEVSWRDEEDELELLNCRCHGMLSTAPNYDKGNARCLCDAFTG